MDQDGFYYVSVNYRSSVVALTFLKKKINLHFIFNAILGRSVRTSRFGSIKLSAAAAVGLEKAKHVFAANTDSHLR